MLRSNVKYQELPAEFQTIATMVREIFLKQGEFRPTVYAVKDGRLCIMDVAMLMNPDDRTKIEQVMVTMAKIGSPYVILASEGWGVEAREADKNEMLAAARRRELHLHPKRIEVLNLFIEQKDCRYMVSGEIKRDPLRMMPWVVMHETRAEMDIARKLIPDVPRFQDIYAKAGL